MLWHLMPEFKLLRKKNIIEQRKLSTIKVGDFNSLHSLTGRKVEKESDQDIALGSGKMGIISIM